MADIDKAGTPSLSSVTPPQNDFVSGLLAGEDIEAGDACYIKAADGKVYLSSADSTDDEQQVVGYATTDADSGEAVTLAENVNFNYGEELNPGADVYLSTTPGAIADDMDNSAWMPIGRVIDATRIRLWRSYWPNGSTSPL